MQSCVKNSSVDSSSELSLKSPPIFSSDSIVPRPLNVAVIFPKFGLNTELFLLFWVKYADTLADVLSDLFKVPLTLPFLLEKILSSLVERLSLSESVLPFLVLVDNRSRVSTSENSKDTPSSQKKLILQRRFSALANPVEDTNIKSPKNNFITFCKS